VAKPAPRGECRFLSAGDFHCGISANERERRLAGLREPAQGRSKLMAGKMFARISDARGKVRIDAITCGRREPVNVIVNCTQQQTKRFVPFRVFIITCTGTQGQKFIDGR
jgi:hypothetical protein